MYGEENAFSTHATPDADFVISRPGGVYKKRHFVNIGR